MDLGWLYPRSLFEFSAIIVIALILDTIYPRHTGVMYRIHPVHTAYVLALTLYRRLPRTKLAGVCIWIIATAIHVGLYASILYILNGFSRMLWILFSAYILKVSISIKLLLNHVKDVYISLSIGDLDSARAAVSNIVRRDVKQLDEGHVASAAIESLFESLVDGFASPLSYYLLLGPLGALLQRIVNTLDSALGYMDEEFREVGWFSAKVDTFINFVPARLEALLIIMLCPVVGGSIEMGWHIYIKYRKATQSLNAGHPMSAASGCLAVKLEKIGSYVIGEGFPPPTNSSLAKAIKVAIYNVFLYVGLIQVLATSIYIWLGKPYII